MYKIFSSTDNRVCHFNLRQATRVFGVSNTHVFYFFEPEDLGTVVIIERVRTRDYQLYYRGKIIGVRPSGYPPHYFSVALPVPNVVFDASANTGAFLDPYMRFRRIDFTI